MEVNNGCARLWDRDKQARTPRFVRRVDEVAHVIHVRTWTIARQELSGRYGRCLVEDHVAKLKIAGRLAELGV
jgi:hypothetical protein